MGGNGRRSRYSKTGVVPRGRSQLYCCSTVIRYFLTHLLMVLSFASDVQSLSYQKVAEYLAQATLFNKSLQVVPDAPRFELTYGSARVAVEVLPWEVHPWDERELAIVKACSCVTFNSSIDADLMQYLLHENQRMLFGAFHLGAEGQVMFAHTVLGGEHMDLMELQSCILSVVTIADTYDDIIAERFGGQRASDRLGAI